MFTKKEVFSIPNILCYFRIMLVPVFMYTYFVVEGSQGHMLSAIILVFSSFSDFLDGYIARRYDMVTELGKLIDPIADKLTQFVVACALMYTYSTYVWLVVIIVLKDGMLLSVGWYLYRKTGKYIPQAQWPGKVATALFFVVSIILVAFYIPNTFYADAMIYTTVACMLIAMIYYAYGLYQIYKEG